MSVFHHALILLLTLCSLGTTNIIFYGNLVSTCELCRGFDLSTRLSPKGAIAQ